ncbi:hypothetical protein [Vibrio sonorensis]|uniref:hypothetical protein n=1 Tax=Vibrio sonorensis TaxID=1004316 RepID=UPI0008DACB8E|nr:hypothetical protein [Vibrio sonorensis]
MVSDLDRIKTMFWCREVFLRLGIKEPGQLAMTKSNEDRHLSISRLLVTKDQDLVFELFLSGPDNPKWEKYFNGERVPANTSNGRSKNRPIRSLVNQVFEGSESYFDNGPYGIFTVLSSNSFSEAVHNLTLACQNCFSDNDSTYLRPVSENDDEKCTWSNQVESKFTDNPKANLERINYFLADSLYYNYDAPRTELLLLSIVGAKTELKFLHNEGRLMKRLTCDPDYNGRETGIETLEKIFGVPSSVWINS